VFYAESGGQVADHGVISDNKLLGEITDVKKQDGVFFHFLTLQKGYLKVGESVDMQIDITRRRRIAANHTATHILHNLLRAELGKFVTQHGSMVSDEKLRFDFNYQKPLDKNVLRRIEQKANDVIAQNIKVVTDIKDQKEAISEGAMALFGEKYGDKVRVVSVADDTFLSRELCGGTHVKFTSEIGLFKILSESSIASGIRRIEAITSHAACEYLYAVEDELDMVKNALGVNSNLDVKLQALMEENKRLTLQNNNLMIADNIANASKWNNGKFDIVFSLVQNMDQQVFRLMSDRFLQKFTTNSVIVLANISDGKISVSVTITNDLCEVDAKAFLLKILTNFGCKGCGGRNNFAQGGVNIANAPANIASKFDISKNTKQQIEQHFIELIDQSI